MKSSPANAANVALRPAARVPSRLGPKPAGRSESYVEQALDRRPVARRPQRNRYAAKGAGGLVVVVITTFVLVSIFGSKGGNTAARAEGTYSLPATVVSEIRDVPVSALVDNAGTGSVNHVTAPEKLPPSAPQLRSGGRPEIMYIGAHFCGSCAGERWALVMALLKFGTFKNLSGTTSSASDIHPGGPTFSFYGATYTSRYLSFVSDEESPAAINGSTSSYESVQTLTEQEHYIITAWDVAPYTSQSGSIPFVDIGGEFLLTGVQYDANAIAQMAFPTAAGVMTSGKSAVSKHVESAAGYLLGDFCGLTEGQPAPVCSQVPSSLIGMTTSSAKNNEKSNSGPSSPLTLLSRRPCYVRLETPCYGGACASRFCLRMRPASQTAVASNRSTSGVGCPLRRSADCS